MIAPEPLSDAGPRADQDDRGLPAPRALIVAEEKRVRRWARRRMQGAGFNVRTTPAGVEALRTARGDPPDLIVVHHDVGWLNVRHLLTQLRNAGRTARIPILLIAPSADSILARACNAWGVTPLVQRKHGHPRRCAAVLGRTGIVR